MSYMNEGVGCAHSLRSFRLPFGSPNPRPGFTAIPVINRDALSLSAIPPSYIQFGVTALKSDLTLTLPKNRQDRLSGNTGRISGKPPHRGGSAPCNDEVKSPNS